MKRYLLLLIIATFALALAACNSSGASEPAAPEPVSFTIEMTEYAFTPNELTVSVGQEVTLTLVNKGTLQHEIMFGRDVMMIDGRPNGFTEDLFNHAGVEPEVQGGMLMIDGQAVMGDEHEEVMGNEMDMADGEEMHMEEDSHGHDGLMVMLPATDDTATMTFVVTEEMVGTWEIGCFELDGVHHDAGMTGSLTVTDS